MKIMKRRRLRIYFWGSSAPKKNIHQEIEETIAERKRILPEWEKIFLNEDTGAKKDIHTQLKETIAAFKLSMREHEKFFIKQNKNAA